MTPHEINTKLLVCPCGIYTIERIVKPQQKDEFVAALKAFMDNRTGWHHGFDITISDDYKRFKKHSL